MAKTRKTPEPPHILQVWDKVRFKGRDTIYLVTSVSPDGRDVDLCFPNTEFERFRVPVSELEWVK